MRLTRKQRIMNYCIQKGFGENAMKLLKAVLDITQNGIVERYATDYHERVVRELFEGNGSLYYEGYCELVKGSIIEMKGLNLVILAWDYNHLFALNSNLPRRKYVKDPIKGQIQLNLPPYISIASKKQEEDKISCDWNRLMGVIIPRSLAPYLTGYRSENEYGTTEEVIRKSCGMELDREEIRRYIALIAQSINGDIHYFQQAYSIRRMQELFGEGTVSESTCYDVDRKLIEKGLISIYEDRQKGYKRLRITGYGDGFGKSKNYVAIPYAVFLREFKQLEIGAIKLFFEFIFSLNNGEDKRNMGKDKQIRRKLFITPHDTSKDKQKCRQVHAWLRRRCNQEVADILFGKKDSTGLREFFYINAADEKSGSVYIRIKEKYFVTKKLKELSQGFDPTERFSRKAGIVRELLKEVSFSYTEKDLQDFILVFRRAPRRIIALLLKTLDIDIRNRQQQGWKSIASLGAYLHEMYRKYLAGDREFVKSSIEEIRQSCREALEDLSSDALCMSEI